MLHFLSYQQLDQLSSSFYAPLPSRGNYHYYHPILLCFLLLYPDAGLPVLHFAFDFVGGHTLDVGEHDALHDGDALWR